jgi:hypothetical protein
MIFFGANPRILSISENLLEHSSVQDCSIHRYSTRHTEAFGANWFCDQRERT